MKKNKCILLQRSYDIDAILAHGISRNEIADNFNIVSVGVDAYARSLRNGFCTELINPTTDYVTPSSIDLEADKLARKIDGLSSELRLEYDFTDTCSYGWEYLYYYMLIYAHKRTSLVASHIKNLLREYEEIHFPYCLNEPDYYLDCWTLRDTLIENISRESNVIKYQFNSSHSSKSTYNKKVNLPKTPFEVLSHLPTVYQHQAFHKERLKNLNNHIDLESPFWDVAVSNSRSHFVDHNLEPTKLEESYLLELRDRFHKVLKIHFNKNILDSILKRSSERSLFQLNFYNHISYDLPYKIKKIEISDHDASFHGPIFSYSELNSTPVDVYPHSNFVVQTLPFSENTEYKLTLNEMNHRQCLGSTSIIKNKFALSKVDNKCKPIGKNILIALNELDDISGMPIENTFEMISSLSEFIKCLESNGYNVAVRFKPGFDYSDLLYTPKINANGDLESAIEWTSLLITVGVPSSIICKFTTRGIRTFHVCSHIPQEIELDFIPDCTELFTPGLYANLFKKLLETIQKQSNIN